MTQDLDVLDLRCLRAVADTGSITGAAALLGYSQPAVTQRLRRAETQLGQPLLLRQGRRVSLTEAGRRLARHAVHVDAALEAAQQDLDDLAGLATGMIRLAGFPSASPTLVPAILSALRHAHPRLGVAYVEVEPPEALELVRTGGVDLALTFSYPGDGRTPGDDLAEGTVETALFRDTMVAVAPVGTFTAGHDALDDLRGARFIGGCPRCRGHLLSLCRATGFEPEIVLETDNALAVTGLVAAGLGVAVLPSMSLIPALLPSAVEVRPLPESDDRVVQVAYARGADRIPAVGAALAAIGGLDPASFGLRRLGDPTRPVGARG